MRNEQLQRVADVFVGDWAVSITNQRWIEDKTATTTGTAKGEWLGDAFVQLRVWFANAHLEGDLEVIDHVHISGPGVPRARAGALVAALDTRFA